MSKLLVTLFLRLYLLNLVYCSTTEVTLSQFVDVLLKIRDEDRIMIPYNESIFHPYNGPYFLPLWKLNAPYKYYSQYGFPDPQKTLSPVLNIEFQKNDVLNIEESSSQSTKYILSETFTLFDLLYKTLTKFANDNETEDDNQISEEVNITTITITATTATSDTVITEGKGDAVSKGTAEKVNKEAGAAAEGKQSNQTANVPRMNNTLLPKLPINNNTNSSSSKNIMATSITTNTTTTNSTNNNSTNITLPSLSINSSNTNITINNNSNNNTNNTTNITLSDQPKKKKRRKILVPTNEDVDESSSNVILGERLQPRMFLPLFIDIYRIFKAIRASCKENCTDYFPNYEYVLWMYNWVICTKIGPTPLNDVDGICPKICRPRKDITLKENYITELINLTFKPIALTMDPFDVCSQLVNTVSGTCLTYGSGVGAEEFTCQCKSHAYEWQTVDSLTGCLLIPQIMNSSQNAHSKTWNIECNEDMKQFCKNSTDKCYYRLRLMDDIDVSESTDSNKSNSNDTTTTTTNTTESSNNNTYVNSTSVNTTRLKLTSNVDISPWPHCQCTKYFTGIDCSESVQPCKEILSNALKKPQLLMHSQVVKDDIDRPIITTVSYDNNEYQKSASGDWLCGVDFQYGSCIPIGQTYQCQCNPGYTKDPDYSDFDNCWKETHQEVAIEIGGHIITKCGQGACVNEWHSWSSCTPKCGQTRYQYRLRSCDSDIGCRGSAKQSQRCPPLECPEIASTKRTDVSIQYEEIHHHHQQHYDDDNYNHILNSSYLSAWFLGFLIPVEIILIIFGVILLEKCILKRSSSSH
ncbi:unnamed protein product [Trichobilharzia szidati]|nr:unnamed protein product [Trichobilharzia szidati]